MPWKLKKSLETTCTRAGFYSGVDVWIRRPNVVNRKLLGAVIKLESKLSDADLLDNFSTSTTLRDLIKGTESFTSQDHAETSKLVVRELLPRAKLFQESLELVIVGR